MSNPEKSPEDSNNIDERSVAEKAEVVRNNRVARKIAQIVYTAALMPRLILYKKGREDKIGLLLGSILNFEVWHPDNSSDQTYRLTAHSADAGEMAGYDFQRATNTNKRPKWMRNEENIPVAAGKMWAFLPDEIADKEPTEYTHPSLFNFRDIDHVLTIRMPSIEQAAEEGLVVEGSYEDAYNNVGLYQDFKAELKARRIHDERVLQVTPKGNSLIFLQPPIGESSPPQQDATPETAFDLGRIRIA